MLTTKLLIEPYGIETLKQRLTNLYRYLLLIEPYGIETA